jgi:hypothetical protein
LITYTFVNNKDCVKVQVAFFSSCTLSSLYYTSVVLYICGSHGGVSEDSSRLCWRCVVVWVVPDVSSLDTTVLRNIGNHSLNDTAYYLRKS